MKKLFILFISMSFICMPAYSIITDDFAVASLDKNLKIKPVSAQKIQDDFAEKTLDKNLKIKVQKTAYITDTFAEKNKNKNIYQKQTVDIKDVLPKINTVKSANKVVISDINPAIEIPVRIKKYYSTRQKINEGDYVDFETVKDVVIKKKTYSKGTLVKARIENVSLNKSMGVPSDLVIGNFSIDGIPLAGEISKTGANRSLWVYPCAYGLMFFFCAGLLFIPIRGGHAKVSTSEIHKLYAK